MVRRSLVMPLALAWLWSSLALAGCDREAKRQAEIAKGDLERAEVVVRDKHVSALAAELPKAAEAISKQRDRAAAFVARRDKTESLRAARRSFYAFTDATGVITWVEDPAYPVVERKLKVGFPAVADVLDGKKPYAEGPGRFGDEAPAALWFVAAAPTRSDGAIDGALVAAWDAHEAADDLGRQLATDAKMQIAAPKHRVKESERLELALDAPQIWVAIFAQDGGVFLPYRAPQPLEDAATKLGFAGKDAAGWTGTVKVTNASWGVASKRIDALMPGYGLAVIRNR